MPRPTLTGVAAIALMAACPLFALPTPLCAAEPAAAPDKPAAVAEPTSAGREAAYTRSIEKRADGVVDALELRDPAKRARVHATVVQQYRALRDWHDANGAAWKELRKLPAAEQPTGKAAEAKASMKTLHDAFLAKLGEDLTPAQVERVKDGMTYNVVRVTYDAFCDMLPQLTDEQKAKILTTLKDAREEAMDAGTSDEKHAIFGRYKGRINNYLSAQGYDLKQATKDWAARRKKAKAAAEVRAAGGK